MGRIRLKLLSSELEMIDFLKTSPRLTTNIDEWNDNYVPILLELVDELPIDTDDKVVIVGQGETDGKTFYTNDMDPWSLCFHIINWLPVLYTLDFGILQEKTILMDRPCTKK